MIPRPSLIEVEYWLEQWDSLEGYVAQEESLEKLFIKTYPSNKNLDDVLIKVCSVNVFYSTNIFAPFAVAKHIVALKIDDKLASNDLTIVNEIAKVKMPKNKDKNFYSFATKYCSHHKPNVYPIYDSFVEKVLMHLKRYDKFDNFSAEELKSYPKYKEILIRFRKYYGLESFDLKQIDKYLWQVGKKYFPKKY